MNKPNKPIGYIVSAVLVVCILCVPTSFVYAEDVDLSGRTEQDMKRDPQSKPVEIINFSGVKAGDNVLDLLGGGGYYTELLSRVVGDKGHVVLQIPQAYVRFAGKALEQRLADDRLKNVTYLLSEASDLKLGTEKYNSIFLVLGYHDMVFLDEGWDFTADAAIPQVLKSLKPGGTLLVVDHNTTVGHGIKDAKTLHRIESAFTKADLEKRGFHFIKQTDVLVNKNDDHTLSVFDKKIRRKTDRFIMLFEKQ